MKLQTARRKLRKIKLEAKVTEVFPIQNQSSYLKLNSVVTDTRVEGLVSFCLKSTSTVNQVGRDRPLASSSALMVQGGLAGGRRRRECGFAVSRILSKLPGPKSFPITVDDHSSGSGIADTLKRSYPEATRGPRY
jgi:hypothetical protein